jgi:drug/metabolite transporter (DMT)-like permease
MRHRLALLLTVVLWASAFPAIRAGLRAYSFDDLVLLRFLTASIVLTLIWIIRGLPLPRWSDIPVLAILGVIGFTLYPLALTFGQQTVSAGAASILVNLSPVFTAILASMFLDERLSATGWLGTIVAFSGACILSLQRGVEIGSMRGLVAILLAALYQGIHFTILKSLLRRYDAVSLTIFSAWAGTAANLLFLPGLAEAFVDAPRAATAAVVFLGVFPTALATIAWSYALVRIPAPQAASFLYLVPPIAVVIAVVWLGEPISARAVVGGMLAMLGVAIVRSGDALLGRLRQPVTS